MEALLKAHGSVHEAGEEQGMPLMPYTDVAEFGTGGIPELRVIVLGNTGEPHPHMSSYDAKKH